MSLSTFPSYQNNAAGLASSLFFALERAVYSGYATVKFRAILSALSIHDTALPAIVAVISDAGSPSQSPIGSSSSGTKATNDSSISLTAGIVAGVLTLFCMAGPLLYYFRRKMEEKKKAESESKKSQGLELAPLEKAVTQSMDSPTQNRLQTASLRLSEVGAPVSNNESKSGVNFSDYYTLYTGSGKGAERPSDVSMACNSSIDANNASGRRVFPRKDSKLNFSLKEKNSDLFVMEFFTDQKSLNMADVYPANCEKEVEFSTSATHSFTNEEKNLRLRYEKANSVKKGEQSPLGIGLSTQIENHVSSDEVSNSSKNSAGTINLVSTYTEIGQDEICSLQAHTSANREEINSCRIQAHDEMSVDKFKGAATEIGHIDSGRGFSKNFSSSFDDVITFFVG